MRISKLDMANVYFTQDKNFIGEPEPNTQQK